MNADSLRLARLKANLERRAQIFEYARSFFRRNRFLEVETPLRVPAVAPEFFIDPLASEERFLIASPELHMKRLLAAGYELIFQFSRCFRKGERGRLHNPEFTLLEWYRAGGGYMDVIADTEQLVTFLAGVFGMGDVICYQGKKINIALPWPRITVSQAFTCFAGWDPVENFDPLRFDVDTVDKVMPSLPQDRPVVLMDYPLQVASLARIAPGGAKTAERAEVFIGGLELVNAYSELNNAAEQKRRFEAERALIEQEKGCRLPLPQSFLEAVGDMPECAGIALGMDRLVMLLCDAASIDEVLAFTDETA